MLTGDTADRTVALRRLQRSSISKTPHVKILHQGIDLVNLPLLLKERYQGGKMEWVERSTAPKLPHFRRELFGLFTERLASFRAIDAIQPNFDGDFILQHGDTIATGNTNDLA